MPGYVRPQKRKASPSANIINGTAARRHQRDRLAGSVRTNTAVTAETKQMYKSLMRIFFAYK